MVKNSVMLTPLTDSSYLNVFTSEMGKKNQYRILQYTSHSSATAATDMPEKCRIHLSEIWCASIVNSKADMCEQTSPNPAKHVQCAQIIVPLVWAASYPGMCRLC